MLLMLVINVNKVNNCLSCLSEKGVLVLQAGAVVGSLMGGLAKWIEIECTEWADFADKRNLAFSRMEHAHETRLFRLDS